VTDLELVSGRQARLFYNKKTFNCCRNRPLPRCVRTQVKRFCSEKPHGRDSSQAKPALTARAGTTGARILLVDDEEAVSRLTRQMLAKLGYEVTAVLDGHMALQAYHESRKAGRGFDVSIVDLTLGGGICGHEVASAVFQADPDARVVITSGYWDPELLAECRELGVCGVLRKPFVLADLQRVVQEALAGNRLQGRCQPA